MILYASTKSEVLGTLQLFTTLQNGEPYYRVKQRFNNLTHRTFFGKFQLGLFKNFLLNLRAPAERSHWDCQDLLSTFPILFEPVIEFT